MSNNSKAEPLTSSERAARLYIKTENDDPPFPSEKQVAEAIADAEFDTINFLDTMMKRHGMDGVRNKLVEQQATIQRLEDLCRSLNELASKRFMEIEKLKRQRLEIRTIELGLGMVKIEPCFVSEDDSRRAILFEPTNVKHEIGRLTGTAAGPHHPADGSVLLILGNEDSAKLLKGFVDEAVAEIESKPK